MADFDAASFAIKATNPNNELLYDDKGIPSVMVYIPKFTMADVITGGSSNTHPAFIVNGQEVDGIWISKYQNIVKGGRAYSLPGEDPAANLTWDTARGYCEAKGDGWHMMTRAEFAAIALWCKAHGIAPLGNNDYGKDVSETARTGIPKTYGTGADAGKIYHIATGSGPVTYSHDGTGAGIFDLNGNVSEWQGGIRTVKGEVQILANNNAADSDHSQAADSAQWKAINAADGSLITPNGSGTTTGSVKIDWASNAAKYDTTIATQSDTSRSCLFANVTASANIGDAAKELLIALGLLPDSSTAADYNGDYFYFNNGAAERLFAAGGNYNGGSNAGVFYLYGNNYTRTYTYAGVGFRSAFVTLPTA